MKIRSFVMFCIIIVMVFQSMSRFQPPVTSAPSASQTAHLLRTDMPPSTGPAPGGGQPAGDSTNSFPSLLALEPDSVLNIYPAFALYSYTSGGQGLVYILDTTDPGTWDFIKSVPGDNDYYAGDFVGGDYSQLYVLSYNSNELHTLNTSTVTDTTIGASVPISGQVWTGATGTADGTLYASSSDLATSHLYTIDTATGAATVVGEITNAPCIIDIAIDADGEMYGLDICNDELVQIDPATGAGTVIGSVGFDANYAQGMDFQASGVLYLAAYSDTSGRGELRIADTATGNSTLVGAFPDGENVTILAFAKPRSSPIQLVQNPGFEDGWDQWQTQGYPSLSSTSHSGAASAYFYGEEVSIWQEVDVPSDVTYAALSYWITGLSSETEFDSDLLCWSLWDQTGQTKYVGDYCWDLEYFNPYPMVWRNPTRYLDADELANIAGQTVLLMFKQTQEWGQYAQRSHAYVDDIVFAVNLPPSPMVTSVTPSSGFNTETVHVTDLAGDFFRDGASVQLTKADQTPIDATNVIVVGETQITCDLDLTGAATGQWDVVVTNSDSQSGTLPNGFTVTEPYPRVTSITPSSGLNTGVVHITDLAGAYFQTGASVKLSQAGQADINATSVSVVSESQITCDFDLTGAAAGHWDVTVTNPDAQSGTLPNGFTVNSKVWNGSLSSDWHADGNWTPSGVPTVDDYVLVPDVANAPIISNGDAAVNGLIIAAGAVLDLSNRMLSVEDTLTNDGTLKQTLDVQTGNTTNFMRITDLAGDQTKYYGLDMTPTGTANATGGAPRIRLAVGEFDPLVAPEPAGLPDALQLSAYPGDGTGYYLVQFWGPIFTSDMNTLAAAGATVFDYIPDFTLVVKMDDASRTAVEQMDQVRWVGLYQPAYRLQPDLLVRTFGGHTQETGSSADGRQSVDLQALWDDDPIDIVISVFRGEALAPIRSRLQDMGAVILGQSQTGWKSKLQVSISPSRLPELAAIPGVRWIEQAPEWQLFNNESADIMGVRPVWDTHGLYGQGQTIAVCDTGLDQGSTSPGSLHDDFEDGSGNSRVLIVHDLVGDGASDVNSGHGTHVAGSVLGNGALSGANPSNHIYPDTAYVGMAPKASLIFQATEENDTGSLSGIPNDLNDLFSQAAASGATLHTNSWGSSVVGRYTSSSEDVDEYVWNHQDFTVLFAAANEGIDSNADGVVDRYSLGSPASAKNCITVGATENERPGITNTWGDWWPIDFSADPINSDPMANNPNGMAPFSSRGPTLDGRYKPDIVAPGAFIASTRSSLISDDGWGAIDANYLYMGGTSMATPLTAGAATVARQYYTDRQGVTPSAALIKATLVNGATNIAPGQYGTGATQEIPNERPSNVAGWGRVDLENSIFPTSPRAMQYEDEGTGLSTGASNAYVYTVTDSTEALRVTLAWSDYPGTPAAAGGLVNDLDLTVTGPGGTTYYPNNANQRGASQHLSYDAGWYTSGYIGNPGDLVAVRFTPTSYPAALQTGQFYLASNSGTYPKTFNWYVYDGDGTNGPNTVLASGSTTIRRYGWHVIDLSGEGLSVSSGDFFLAIEMPDDDLVWTYENYTPIEGRSWYYSGSWSRDTNVDYLFNAVVSSPGGSTNQDRVNNLVGVDIANPPTGEYVVTVFGYNVPQGPQPYALVASGAIAAPAPTAPTVASITPSSGFNTGVVHITNLAGSNFQTGASVKLSQSGQADINATNVNVLSESQITCDFDLTGAATGQWGVVVTNPDAQSGTLANGFTVNPPAADKTWNGSLSSDWHTAGNWTPSGVPTSADDTLIPNTTNDPVISNGDASVNSLTVNAGAVLDLTDRNLTVEGTLTNNGTLGQAQDVVLGSTTNFLRITNLAGDQTKYYGLDITHSGSSSLAFQAGERAKEFASPAPNRSEPTHLTQAPASGEANGGPIAPTILLPNGVTAFAVELLNADLVSFDTDIPVTLNVIGNVGGNYYAGDFLNGDFSRMYAIDDDTHNFVTIDTATSAITVIGMATPASGHTWTGLAGDPTNGILYGSSTNESVSTLYTFNVGTGAPTIVGNVTNAPALIGIAINAAGEMYGLDIGNDVLLSIDKATGAGTVIGPVGFNADYAQGMDFDEEGDVLYLAAFDGDALTAQLRIANTSTGNTTLVGTFPANTEIDSLSIATGGVSNTPPVAADDAYTTTLDTPLSVAAPGVLGNDTDADEDPLTAVLDAGPLSGTLSLSVDGSFIYIPDTGFSGSDGFTYHANDGSDDSNVATVAIEVVVGNTPPTLSGLPDQQVPMNGSADNAIDLWNYASDAEDADADLSFSIANSPAPSAGVTLDSNRYVDINPAAGWTGVTDVEIQVQDTGGLTDTDSFQVTISSGAPGTGVTVSVSGNQLCSGRDTGVERCFDITPAAALTATVRFYYSEAERNDQVSDNLLVYHYDADWTEEPGPYTRGGTGDAQYVQAQNVDDFSLFALDSAPGSVVNVHVFVSGNQFCPGRFAGVKRCYDIMPAMPLTATVRFYFDETERNDQVLDDLLVYHYNADWIEEPGPYTRGGTGDAQYVQAQNVDDFSLFALHKVGGGGSVIYLPVVLRIGG